MELIDLYDGKRNPLNKIINRLDKVKQGQYSIIVGVWVLNSKGELLTTLRDKNKSSYPNLWENTAGAVQSGENSLQAGKRELFEETGIYADEKEFIKISEVREWSVFVDNYVLCKDVTIEDIVLLEGETQDAKFVTFDTFKNMICNDVVAKPVARRFYNVFEELLKISNEIRN